MLGEVDKNRHLGHTIPFLAETPWPKMNESNYNYYVINVPQKKEACTNTYEEVCTGMQAGGRTHMLTHTLTHSLSLSAKL